MTWAVFVAFVAASIKYATVFIFGSTGEAITEKSGHLNMGIPGIMYFGALGGILGEKIYIDAVPAAQLNGFMILFMPLIFAALFGAIGGAIFSFFTVTLKCNHNVTGLTLTTLLTGFSCFFIGTIKNTKFIKPGLMMQSLFVPQKFDWGGNWFGQMFFSQSLFTYLAIIIAIIAAIIISRTRVGLNLRACGENPAAADAAGINVNRYRYLATIIGASIAGIGGMVYELDCLKGLFNANDSIDALGWLCLSIVIFSIWKPSICVAASILFGLLICLPNFLTLSSAVLKEFMKIVPYIATVVVLIITSVLNRKNAQPPAALGVTYFREDR